MEGSNLYYPPSGDAPHCVECRRIRAKLKPKIYNPLKAKIYRERWTNKNPDYWRKHDLESLYNLSWEQYEALLKKQDYKCAICLEPTDKFNVDHDHSCCPVNSTLRKDRKTCGKCVRGLLCDGCNTALGRFKDSKELLQRAIDYLGGS